MTATGTKRIMDIVKDLPDETEDQIINLVITVRNAYKTQSEISHLTTSDENEDLAKCRRELLKSKKYIRSSGRTHEEIDAMIKELRNDRM